MIRRTRPIDPSSQQATRAVSIDDVIKMVQLGLGESTIVQYIGSNGAKQTLNVSDLIRLHEAGVSERIINSLQSAKTFKPNTNSKPVGTGSPGHPVNSERRVLVPARRMPDVNRFGPSILEPQQRSPVETLDVELNSTEITPKTDL